jgi:Thiamine pyrophosphate enzyme, N-terminal TPP binding domain
VLGKNAEAAEIHKPAHLTAAAGSCGPGSLHFINGIFEANRNRAPVVLIASQIVRDELGFDFIQEVDFKQVYQACSVFCDMICPPGQARRKTTIACQTALSKRGVAFSLCQPTFPRHPCATTSHFPVMLQIRLFGRATQSLRKSPTFFRRSFSSYCHPSRVIRWHRSGFRCYCAGSHDLWEAGRRSRRGCAR